MQLTFAFYALIAASLAWAGLASGDDLTPLRAFRVLDKKTAPELPESIVIDLLQDDAGMLWIATLGGMASYDGLVVRAVHDTQAPTGGWIELTPRAAGGFYAGSRRGVHVFDGNAWRRLATAQPVVSLAEDGQGWLWAVFGDAAWKTRADAEASVWQRADLPAGTGGVQLVLADHAGGLFVLGSTRYLHCRAGACVPLAAAALPSERLTAALTTRAGALWLAAWDGQLQVSESDTSGWRPVALGRWESGGIRSLAEDRLGQVWAGGTARLCHGEGSSAWSCWGTENGIPGSAVLSLLADREGTLWLGLNGAGLSQWVGEPWSHLRQWPGQPAISAGIEVTGVAQGSDGTIVASVFGRGILRWDGHRLSAWDRRDGLDEDIRAVLAPVPGVVWAAARHGIFESTDGGRFRRTLALASDFASGFVMGPDHEWYAWTDDYGVYRRGSGWEPAREINALLPDASVRSMAFSDGGDLWVGTATGLVVRRRGGATERIRLGVERGMPESIAAIVEVAPGEVWVGGNRGVVIFRDRPSHLLTDTDGVPGNVYFLRRAPDGSVWVGGSKGICHHRAGQWTCYDARNGLLSEECNNGALVLADGSLLAATSGSLAHFDARVPAPPAVPLRVFWRNAPAAARDGIVPLQSDQRRLALAWSAPWLAPQPVEYRTRVGSDAAWSLPTQSTQMAVENLPAGASEIAVEARLTGAGAWTPPATLRIDVAPFVWETATAKLTSAAVAAGLVLLAGQLHVRRLQQRREQALARVRNDFMASASHELRTPIAQIRLFADTLRFGRVRSEQERMEALDTIHRATQRLEALSGNLLQLARGQAGTPACAPRRLDVAELLSGAVRDLAPLALGKDVTIDVIVEPELQAHLDAEGMRQAASNLIDNAVKYGPRGQSVKLGAEHTSGGLRVWVEDRGPGIPETERERVWERFVRLERDRNTAVSGTGIGLAVVRDVVTRSGGRAWIEAALPTGTRVVLLLPQPAPEAG